jgi:succinate-semialdehyde dehydrogenase/glutarate-semialdehyde dehydrogenase
MKLSARSEAGDRIVSIDPATLEALGDVRISTKEEVEAAVARARAAQKAWGARPFRERAEVLLRVNDAILDAADEIADLVSRENGKTATTAMFAEVLPVADLIPFFAKNGEEFLSVEPIPLRHMSLMGRRSYMHYPPLGVIGVISPWNFPFSIPCGTIAMALLAGNAVVLKPSEVTPLVGLKIGELFRKGGVPEGVLEVVTGDGTSGAALCEAAIEKLVFTGSGRTGRRVMEACAKRLTPVLLELGGNAPMLVLRDADLDTAAAGAAWGSFFNTGQVCASVQRIYVDRTIAEPFTAKLLDETKRLRVGVGRGGEVEIGALTSLAQLRVVEDLVEDAKKRGAKVLCGGKRWSPRGSGGGSESGPGPEGEAGKDGYFYEPTLLSGVDHTFRIAKEEVFGPVAAIMTFDSEDEAVSLANDTRYGLMASVWTKDLPRGERIAERIESGTVCVNDHAVTFGFPETPWGGSKESGFGRTHGRMGLLEFVDWRHVHVNAKTGWKQPWWFPEKPGSYRALRSMAEALGRRGVAQRVAALVSAAKGLLGY